MSNSDRERRKRDNMRNEWKPIKSIHGSRGQWFASTPMKARMRGIFKSIKKKKENEKRSWKKKGGKKDNKSKPSTIYMYILYVEK